MHNFIGGLNTKTGLGHMSDVPVVSDPFRYSSSRKVVSSDSLTCKQAAFDPIFFFHHCNIDRHFAIWQALNPYDFSNPSANPERWLNPSDKDYNGQVSLRPFRHKSDDKFIFWTPDACYDTKPLGYEYDDTQRKEGESDAEYRARLIASLDKYINTGKLFFAQPDAPVMGLASTEDVRAQASVEVPDYIISVIYDRYGVCPHCFHQLFCTSR